MPETREAKGKADGRWHRYWNAEGGRTAAAMVRIAIAASVLLTLLRLWSLPSLTAPHGLYRPVGAWMLLGATRPPDAVVGILWFFAWTGSIAMLLGFATRASTVVSFVAASSLAALSFSSSTTWAHQYNLVFLAQLAFLGARGGDVLSLDAIIRHHRGLPLIDQPNGYRWSLRLVQLAVALMFAGAVFHKIVHGHGTLRWAFSDSLRHHLLVRYDLAGLDRTALVEWIIDDVWRYRLAALANMITQLLPILACIFVNRPWLRAVCGALFVTEVLALELVVRLWNPHWLPLVAVFIDWDALFTWIARRPGRAPAVTAAPTVTAATTSILPPPPRGRTIFIHAFLVYEVVTSFIPAVDQRLNTYPFSGFPMFATIRAAAPYDEHLPYRLAGDRIEPVGTDVHRFAQRWLDHSFRGLYRETKPERIRARLASIIADAPARYPDATIKGLRHYLAIFEAPAYPAKARFDRHPIAITGELSPDGTFRTMLGTWKRADRGPIPNKGPIEAGSVVELQPQNVDTSTVRLVYYADNDPTPHDLTTTQVGNRYTLLGLSGSPIYIVAFVGDMPWLVARRE